MPNSDIRDFLPPPPWEGPPLPRAFEPRPTPVDLWFFSLSEDKDTIMREGAGLDVSIVLLDTPRGQMMGLSQTKQDAIGLAKKSVKASMLAAGNYTFYRISQLPFGSEAQVVVIKFEDIRGEVSMVVLYPARIPSYLIEPQFDMMIR